MNQFDETNSSADGKETKTNSPTSGSELKKRTLFKKAGNALTKLLGSPLSVEFNLKCGAIAGAAIGASINPWTIPTTTIVGLGLGTVFSFFVTDLAFRDDFDDKAVKDKDDKDSKKTDQNKGYRLEDRLVWAGLVGVIALPIAAMLTGASTVFVYSNFTEKGQAEQVVRIQQRAINKEQKARALENVLLAEREGKNQSTIKMTDGSIIALKNVTATPKSILGLDLCEISWVDPTENNKPYKATIYEHCSNITKQLPPAP